MRRPRSMPDLPRRLARGPQLFQHALVAQRIHGMPEAAMLERHHLTHGGKTDNRRTLPARLVALDEIEHARGEHEEAAVDQSPIAARLLDEGGYRVSLTLDGAVASRRPYCGDRRQSAVAKMKFDLRADIEIAQAVAIGEAECFFVLDVVGYAAEPAAGQRVLAGVDQRHPPGLRLLLVHNRAVVRKIERHVGHVQEVVGEIFLDDVALITAADHE